MIKKIYKTYQTIRFIPKSRYFWLLLRRSQRKIYSAFPEFTYKHFQKKAANTQAFKPSHEQLNSFSETFRSFCSQTDTKSERVSDSEVACLIHGSSGIVAIDTPYVLEGDLANKTYLWGMSVSYLNGFWTGATKPNYEDLEALTRLAEAYTTLSAMSAPKAFSSHWHPYAASHRLINMTVAAVSLKQFYHDTNGVEALLQTLNACISFHTHYITANTEYDIHYNHLTKNLLALLLSSYYQNTEVKIKLWKSFRRAVEYQINQDGGHAELCPMYHNMFLTDLICLSKAVDKQSDDYTWVNKRISELRKASETWTFKNNEIALFSDSWLGETPSPQDLGIEPVNTDSIRLLPDTGYIRVNNGPLELIMDVGPVGPKDNPGHGHDDFLSIIMMANNRPLFVDYGVSSYQEGSQRDKTRSNILHNAPRFLGAKGIDAWKAFRVLKSAEKPSISYEDLENKKTISASFIHLGEKEKRIGRTVNINSKGKMSIIDSWYNISSDDDPITEYIIPLQKYDDSEKNIIKLPESNVTLRFSDCEVSIKKSTFCRQYGQEEDGYSIIMRPSIMQENSPTQTSLEVTCP